MPDPGTEGATHADLSDIRIQDVVGTREQTWVERLVSNQAFWVTVALIIICLVLGFLVPQAGAFATAENLYNISRNFSFIGIMAVGMVAVIITGGIDLSVGSLMGLVGVVCGVVLQAGYSWWLAVFAGLLTGFAAGAVNGILVAYVGLSSFVVTLGMLSFARSLAVVLSQNKMLYSFGPGGPIFKEIGGGAFLGLSNPIWVLVILAIALGLVLKWTPWGRHLYAIGGNAQAARLTGVPVDSVKMQAYITSGLTAAIA